MHLLTVEMHSSSIKRLRIYKILSKNNVTEIAETVKINVPIALITTSTYSVELDGLDTVLLTCIGSGNVYLSNAVSGVYLRSMNVVLASASYVGMDNSPLRLAVDRHADEQVLLYIYHQKDGVVSMHALTYE